MQTFKLTFSLELLLGCSCCGQLLAVRLILLHVVHGVQQSLRHVFVGDGCAASLQFVQRFEDTLAGLARVRPTEVRKHIEPQTTWHRQSRPVQKVGKVCKPAAQDARTTVPDQTQLRDVAGRIE
jgi:hypothetical protein